MSFKESCRGKKKPSRRPWHKKPCPPPEPSPVPPPKPAPKPPARGQKPRATEGRGRCWTCAFWEGPIVKRPNVGTCELTMMLADGEHPYKRSLAKVEVDAGKHCNKARYVLVTHKHFGCPQWKRG